VENREVKLRRRGGTFLSERVRITAAINKGVIFPQEQIMTAGKGIVLRTPHLGDPSLRRRAIFLNNPGWRAASLKGISLAEGKRGQAKGGNSPRASC